MHPIAVLAGLALASASAIPSVSRDSSSTAFSCRPGQSCWPGSAEWAAFNSTLGGALRATVPLVSSCYASSSDYNKKACLAAEASYSSGEYRAKHYGQTQNLQWETCGSAQCQVNTLSPQPPPITGNSSLDTCALGSLSAYYVNATNQDHVVKTIKFANAHQLRLTVKNTGHDYLGRSSLANSLALWTHYIKSFEYHSTFTPQNCTKSTVNNVGVIGSGVQASEAIAYFAQHGMDVTVGAEPSIGIAGGFGMGGGHGIQAPKHGLMVDQAVEFDVVTAAGEFKTINACQDSDLFWAMRGGGGGTYAVMIQYKMKVYPAEKVSLYGFYAQIPQSLQVQNQSESKIWPTVLSALMSNQTSLSKAGTAGYHFFHEAAIESYIVASTNDDESFRNVTSKYAAALSALPGLQVVQNNYTVYQHYADYANSPIVAGLISRDGPVAYDVLMNTRLVPETLLTPSNSSKLLDAILSGMTTAFKTPSWLQWYATTPYNTPDPQRTTGVNPAWRGAPMAIYYVSGYVQGTSQSDVDELQTAVDTAIKPLQDLTPGGGCYMNEAAYTEPNWQQTFFGANYDRLLSIKNTYDPQSFFNCWKCVGWNARNDPLYGCYPGYGEPAVPTVPQPAVCE